MSWLTMPSSVPLTKGIGHAKVEGEENHEFIHTNKQTLSICQRVPHKQLIPKEAPKTPAPANLQSGLKQVKATYDSNCAACHQPDGKACQMLSHRLPTLTI